MVTLRTYWSPAQAALAKTLLDNYEIPCALLDENSGLYNRGAQFAVPIRLVVDEAEIDRAILILDGDFEKAAEIETIEETPIPETIAPEVANRNPWELLVLAFFFLVPAISVLRTKYSDVIAKSSWARYAVAHARVTHCLSWLLVIAAVVLIFAYFQIRRASLRSLRGN